MLKDDAPQITEKDNAEEIKAWFEESKKVTIETLPAFVNHVMGDYKHDYGTVVNAVAACALAGARAADHNPDQGGITGFQASCVMWAFIREWMSKNAPMRLVDYEQMLYPQYSDIFEKTIPTEVMTYLVKTAKEFLQNDTTLVDPRVVEHWKRVAEGIPPFGFKVVPR